MTGETRSVADITGEPWAFYDSLRETGGVCWDDEAGAWLVSSHELIREIALAEGRATEVYPLPGRGYAYPENLSESTLDELSITPRIVQNLDGEEHDAQHRWWMRAFTPRVIGHWKQAYIRPVCEAEIDRFCESGRVELISEYADRVPPRVFTALLGLQDASDEFIGHLVAQFRDRSRVRQAKGLPFVDPEWVQAGLAAAGELRRIIGEFVLTRRESDAEDLLGMIWRDAADVFGPDWTEDDVIGTVAMLWDAGTHTTSYALTNALYLMLSLRGETDVTDASIVNIVEESLRLYGPVYTTAPRIALETFKLGRREIKQGDRILLLLNAGGTDPRRYECPMDPDLNRQRPRDHLAFFAGRRSCIGQTLARAEVEVSLRVLRDRLPDVQLDAEGQPPTYRGSGRIRRWEPINARFTPPAEG